VRGTFAALPIDAKTHACVCVAIGITQTLHARIVDITKWFVGIHAVGVLRAFHTFAKAIATWRLNRAPSQSTHGAPAVVGRRRAHVSTAANVSGAGFIVVTVPIFSALNTLEIDAESEGGQGAIAIVHTCVALAVRAANQVAIRWTDRAHHGADGGLTNGVGARDLQAGVLAAGLLAVAGLLALHTGVGGGVTDGEIFGAVTGPAAIGAIRAQGTCIAGEKTAIARVGKDAAIGAEIRVVEITDVGPAIVGWPRIGGRTGIRWGPSIG
jgi:hypothetical protein